MPPDCSARQWKFPQLPHGLVLVNRRTATSKVKVCTFLSLCERINHKPALNTRSATSGFVEKGKRKRMLNLSRDANHNVTRTLSATKCCAWVELAKKQHSAYSTSFVSSVIGSNRHKEYYCMLLNEYVWRYVCMSVYLYVCVIAVNYGSALGGKAWHDVYIHTMRS